MSAVKQPKKEKPLGITVIKVAPEDEAKRSETHEGFMRWVSQRVFANSDLPYNNQIVMNNFFVRIIHYLGYPVDQINYTCTLFKYIRGDVSINYSVMFSVVNDTELLRLRQLTDREKFPFIEFYCNNPSLLSQDGEYRGPAFGISELLSGLMYFQKFYDFINDLLIDYLNEKNVTLEFENFTPQAKVDENVQVLSNYIVDKGLLYNFYTNFWLLQMDGMERGIQENHINPKYMSIVFDDIKAQQIMFRKIKDHFGIEFDGFISFLRYGGKIKVDNNRYVPNVFYANPMGQKLRPLKVSEVASPFQLSSPAWREVYLSCRINLLMMNYCCSTFPAMSGWFYIKNSKKTIFDNDAQYVKRERSERAMIIASKLREASRLTHTQQIVRKKIIKNYAYELFDTTDQKINQPLTYIIDNILMSNVTIGMFIEHTGRTVFDLPILEQSKSWIELNGKILSSETNMKKLLFDICYSIHTLNRHEITHSDLHLNNITVMADPANKKTDLFVIDDMKMIFPEYPKAFLIDFSRGTIDPAAVSEDIIFPRAMSDSGMESFITDQNTRILNKLNDISPSILKLHGDQLKKLIISNFSSLYHIYMAVDLYDFSSRMITYLDKYIPASIKKLLKKIEGISNYYLTNMLVKYTTNPELRIDLPSYVVLKECFQEFLIDKSFNISQITNIWNPKGFGWKYSVNAELPPEFQELKTRSLDGVVRKPKTMWSVALLQYYNLRKTEYLKMIDYIAEKHQIIGKYA